MFPSSQEEFIKFTQEANLIPVYQEYSAALETPLAAFLKLNKGPYAFLLESVEKGTQIGRYSFIGFEPSIIFQAKNGEVTITNKEQNRTTFQSVDPLKDLEKIFQKYQPLKTPDLPGFTGGAVGYFGFDMFRYWEDVPKKQAEDNDYPDCFFIFPEYFLIFDHVKQTMTIVISVAVGENPETDYQDAINKIQVIAQELKKPVHPSLEEMPNSNYKNTEYSYNSTSSEFQEMVKKAKEYIKAGDIFQLVLSRKMEFQLLTDPLIIYRNLRSLNPSPYMFYLSFADIKLIGSSPEMLVKVKDSQVEIRPIAGTRPRGRTVEEDNLLAKELLVDEKEKAEHLMLVDLGRNDLGRISKYGSVQVKDYMQIEDYSHVKHIVSKVVGELNEGCNSFDAIRATFPAGTVSGAPKIRAMEIINELESTGRGPYAGAVGYISYTGDMDTCIAIRTIITKGSKGFIQAGAGIVADSDPAKEYQEVCNKAKALIDALEMAERGEFNASNNR